MARARFRPAQARKNPCRHPGCEQGRIWEEGGDGVVRPFTCSECEGSGVDPNDDYQD